MSPLAFWGLPDRSRDGTLFGGEPGWPADRYAATEALSERRQRGGGSDVDLDPLAVNGRIVELTATDADRAAILRRYRLFTRQPDEMITLMALQRMKPRQGDLDPRLYQYGGAYVYLVGGLIKAASVTGLLTLTSDLGTYLARPELFARFYLVGRFLSLAFAAGALAALVHLGRMFGCGRTGWLALALAALCPVFITMALEAKPHMPAACMILWAVVFAVRFDADGRTADAIRMGLAGGLAFGLVLTGLAAAAIVPVLLWLHRRDARRLRLVGLAALLAAAVYAVTNPYVIYNFLFDRAALTGNIDNSTAMYDVGRIGGGAWRVAQLALESCTPPILLAGLVGLAILLRRSPRQTAIAAAPAVATLLITVAIGAGKPAEYARFLLLPAALLALGAAAALRPAFARSKPAGEGLARSKPAGESTMERPATGRFASLSAIGLAAAAILWPGGSLAYVRNFALDAWSGDETRRAAARWIEANVPPAAAIGVPQHQEPAPYGTPPFDLAHRRVVLIPAEQPTRLEMRNLPDWVVAAADDLPRLSGRWWTSHYELKHRWPQSDTWISPIAWANKPVFLFRRQP